MRGHESRRGDARVTGDADLEGVELRKIHWESADGFVLPVNGKGDNAKGDGLIFQNVFREKER